MNMLVALLAAADAEVFKVVALVVFAVLVGIVKFLAMLQQRNVPKGGPRPPQPPQPVPKDAADEIDDFLRRAAQQRTVQQRAVQPVQPIRLQAVKPAAQQPVVAQVVAAAPVGGQVTDHVTKYLDTGDFTRRGDQLGEEVVAQVDREIDQHLHQVFDHSLSQIAATPGETAAAPEAVGVMELPESSATEIPSTFATDLAALLNNPDSIRHAIVLNEIIHRPEERW